MTHATLHTNDIAGAGEVRARMRLDLCRRFAQARDRARGGAGTR